MAAFNQTGAASTARDTIDRAGSAAAQAGHDAGDAVKDVTRKASEAVGEAVGQAGEMAQEKLDSMAAYVRRNPLQATAIAAGIGFAFALIARR